MVVGEDLVLTALAGLVERLSPLEFSNLILA
jgi:hypothetical protein